MHNPVQGCEMQSAEPGPDVARSQEQETQHPVLPAVQEPVTQEEAT